MARNISKESLTQKIEKVEKAISEGSRSFEDIMRYIQGAIEEEE